MIFVCFRIVGSVGLDLKRNSIWKKAFHGGLLIEPHMPELQQFKTYFLKSLKVHARIATFQNLFSQITQGMFRAVVSNPQPQYGWI